MTHKITEAPKIIDSRPGQYVILSLCAQTDEWNELVAIGTQAASEHEITPPLVQVTPLGAVDDSVTPAPRAVVNARYLVTVTRAKRR